MSFFSNVTPQAVSEAEDGFAMFDIGENEAYIKSVKETTSKSGNPMLEIVFVNKAHAELTHYIVDNEWKLSKVKQLCKAFDIPFDDCTNINRWINRVGIVVCKESEYNGKKYPKVSFFKPKEQTKPQTVTVSREVAEAMATGTVSKQNDDGFVDDIPDDSNYYDKIPF